MGKYLCPCYKITKEDVKAAIKDGAESFEQVKKATKASERCGKCKCDVKKYTKKRLEKADKTKKQDKAGKSQKADKAGKSQKADKAGKAKKADKAGKAKKADKSDKA